MRYTPFTDDDDRDFHPEVPMWTCSLCHVTLTLSGHPQHIGSKVCARRVERTKLYESGWAPVRTFAKTLIHAGLDVHDHGRLTGSGKQDRWGPTWALVICASVSKNYIVGVDQDRKKVHVVLQRWSRRTDEEKLALEALGRLSGWKGVARLVNLRPVTPRDDEPLWWLDATDERR